MATAALQRFSAFYNRKFDSHPTTTLVTANGALSTLADILTQTSGIALAKDNPPEYDWARTGRFLVFGLGMGPIVGGWLRLLERGIPMPAGGSIAVTVKRVLADQAVIKLKSVGTGIAYTQLAMFTGSMGLMEGKTVPELQQKFRDVYWTALKANWKVWPFIQGVNMGVVPLAYRLPFQQTCGIGWNMYLSFLNARENKKEQAMAAAELKARQ